MTHSRDPAGSPGGQFGFLSEIAAEGASYREGSGPVYPQKPVNHGGSLQQEQIKFSAQCLPSTLWAGLLTCKIPKGK